MRIKESISELWDGEGLHDMGDYESSMAESYYYGTINSIVDLIRTYGQSRVMSDIRRIMDEWDANK
jgi:hypothetical protein